MAKPVAEIHPPTNLYPTSAFLHGMCRSMGGLPTKFAFGYSTPYSWHYTPWWDVDHDGEVFDYNVENIGWKPVRPLPPMIYRWPMQAYAMAYNADGTHESKRIRIWLPKPTDPKLGAPWTITAFGGSCYDHSYSFVAFTDIACRLTAYVGTRKPWVSPTTHITRGVVFHHDAIVIFRYNDALTQAETGDAITHTYDYRYRYFDHAYWILFIGTVDGKDSPSVSAPYKFLCVTPPIMTIDDAFDITHNSAKLPGHLIDDKGLPVYCRFNYGIKPDYTADTPTLGPERHPFDYVQKITDLQAETEYRFRAEGSHEVSFPYHGISRPKDFLTLPAPSIFFNAPALPQDFMAESPWGWGYEYVHTHPGMMCTPTGTSIGCLQQHGTGDNWKLHRSAFVFDTRDIPPGATIRKATLHFICGNISDEPPGDLCFVNANGIALPCYASSFGALLPKTSIVAQVAAADLTIGEWYAKDLDDLSVVQPGDLTIIGFREYHELMGDGSVPPSGFSFKYTLLAAEYTAAPPYLAIEYF